ncbi:malate dehydrogenase, mitochondrial-like [Cylas formicarius]|uniref:malate dehydrogenase, mitochondrial-like n=1 Tax=Cylas formicarius TaxID=197179 RepID=UPI0029583812|nr:malate dehydrogenase, mitochondrial-like [Cylas formicarius]
MLTRHLLHEIQPRLYSEQKSVQVSVLGANTRLGRYTSFLLKQNPLVSALHLQGCEHLPGLAADLNFCDTKCAVHAHSGDHNVSKAIKSADIILFLPNEKPKEDVALGERVTSEGTRLYSYLKECTVYSPRAILVMCVPPVSITTPIATAVFKQSHFYHPGRIIGSTAFAQVKANTLVGRYHDLDPRCCDVPLVGGPDIDLAVPLFSRARPVGVVGRGPQILTAKFRGVNEEELLKCPGSQKVVDNSQLAESYALNMLVSTIALGICGDPNALANVYLRSNVLTTCRYLVNTVRFARGGVVHNYGVPELTKLELGLFERAVLEIKDRERMAREFVDHMENKDAGKGPPFTEKQQRALKEKLAK